MKVFQRFSSPSPPLSPKRKLINRALIFVGLTVVLSFFFPRGKSLEFNYEVGDITQEEIVAQFDFPILKDAVKYQADVDEATRKVPYLFDRKQEIRDEQEHRIHEFMETIKRLRRARKNLEEAKRLLWVYGDATAATVYDSVKYAKAEARVASDSARLISEEAAFISEYPFDLDDPIWLAFIHEEMQPNGEEINYEEFEQNVIGICRSRWVEGILDIEKEKINSDQVAIRNILESEVPELGSADQFHDLNSAWKRVRSDLKKIYPREDDIQGKIAYKVIVEFMKPNLIWDREATLRHQQDVKSRVPRAEGNVSKNEQIVDGHARVTPEILQKLRSYLVEYEERQQEEKGFGVVLPWIGRIFLVAIMLSFFFSFLRTYRRTLFEDNKMLLLFSTMYLLMVAVGHLFVFRFEISEYSIPITVAAMVLTVLLDGRIAIMATVTLSVILAFMIGNRIDFVIVALFTTIAAVYAVRNLRTRLQLFSAILYIILSGVMAITSLGVLKGTEWASLRDDYLFLAIGGMLAPFVTYGLSALFEIVFGITSDLTLLELSDFSHPLLKRLSQEANGTFNHSVVVGNLAESCAAAVGANPLFCRVGAYYHDIGKMQRSEYFIENQFHSENKHEKLSPTLSAKIIASHVRDGLKLAKEYRLPKAVSDFIPMHHGTTRIEYFYQKALDQADEDVSRVSENDFRYPGPKPNTKETGILMICEAVEAAVRSLKNPTLRSIEVMVNKIIENRLKENQLDECPLTMRDLARMKGDARGNYGLLPVLKGIYHLRIEYPGQKRPSSASS